MMLINKRITSLLLVFVMLCSMMPTTALASENAETASGANELAGKTISILGASISTYTGISNNTAYNSTIGSNAVYYTEGRYGVYANDTWWMQAANDLGLRLLVNNSWSGSSLLYERNGTAGAYVDRCVQLHNNEGEEPDIIGIQMGTNDFQYYKDTLGTSDIDYTALIIENDDGSFTYATPATSLEAAAIVLHKISIRYPDAEVYYLNISQRIDGTDELIRSFNAELKQVVEYFGAHIVDIYGSAITMADFDTYIGDGRVHPNKLGMDAYAEAFKQALTKNTAYKVDTHTVSLNLDRVAADYGDDKIIVCGQSFTAKLTAAAKMGLDVTVTMGGKDITSAVYSNGTITIDSVTDDVTIRAKSTYVPQNYRWELDGTDLVCVSGSNALTKGSGTTTDGVFSKTSYTLGNEVVLFHDLPWVVEWKCEGTFQNSGSSSGARIFTSDNVNANYNARYIFKSNTNGIVAMGEKTTSGSHNYGIALGDYGIDWAALHTYRLENRIAADGSNMIYLLVDGEEIGPMNHHYIGTKDQKTTSDWLSGKDFVFPYMGTDTHGFTNASIDYIQVWEGGHSHTYENGTCAGCGAIVSPYLQQLPENMIGCTNLYDSLVPVKGYYTATKYDTSNGNVLSVVIPVEPGDRIAASSFGPVSENMGSANGIRVTYLLGNEIVSSLSPVDVYNGYTTNGYITVPDGVDAVCIPWWKPSDSNWLALSQISKNFAVHRPKAVCAQAPTCTEIGYTAGEICEICDAALGSREEIPATGHTYSGDTCTACGAINLAAILGGKYVSILGDSISTFNGYSNDAAVNTTIGANGPRYDAGTSDTKPGSYCLLESVNDTWWMHFANRSGMKLLLNNSWAGSQVFGGQTSDGRVIPAAYLDRCVNLHDNTLENNPGNAPINPDVIFVYLGINDYNFNRGKVGTGTVDYAGLVDSDGTYVTPETFGEAYGIMLHKMRNAYPDTQIFAMTLLPENLYSVDKTAWEQHNAYIRAAAEYFDIPVVDLAENCAITWENYSGYMIDKIHPTTAGMKLISDCIEAELAAYYQEKPPHTHSYTSVVTAPTCTEKGYTTYTCACGDSYVDDYVYAKGHNRINGICTVCGDSFAGKKVSILSHSMSTYAGVSNSTAANSTIGSNDVYYTEGRLGVYQKDTWWQQVIDALDMELLVNNSWSGSCVFMPRKGEASVGYGDRAVNLHNDHTGEEPDIIFVYLGCNDFAYYQDTFGKAADVDYTAMITENGDGTFTYAAPTTTCEAYAIMLHKVTNRYPDADIYCMTSTARRETDYTGDTYPDAGQPTAYSAELQKVAQHFDYPVIDLENAIPKEVEIFDKYIGDKRAHANALGMDQISNEVLSVMLDRNAEICHVTADNGAVAEQAVLLGGSYTGKVNIPQGYSVVVTMGGKDVTTGAYKDGRIVITEVTGDIHVETVINRDPQNFHWEFQDGFLTSVGSSENVLTKLSGTVANNILNDGIFQLDTPVVLKHDLSWAVEWKCAEDWRGAVLVTHKESATKGMTFLTRTKGGQLCFGTYTGSQYDNYGIDISGLNANTHTYLLENRIAADGSNMIWLYVDGEEVGPMNNYFIGSKDQNKTSNWISGKDFVFSFIGMTGHALRNCQLDYLSVTECVHAYENGTCTLCGATLPGPVITRQPTDFEASLGESFCVTVEAQGKNLKYQWYFRNAGSNIWYKSGVRDNTYDDVMTRARMGREIYCVITDANGNSVATETVKLIGVPSVELEITQQPTNGEAILGEEYCVTVEAKGDGLKYQWYFRNAGSTKWYRSSVRDNTYDNVMTRARAGREIYCVVTDAYGNSVATDVVTLVRIPIKLELTAQPTDATAGFGENFCATVEAKGEGLKYQWYFRNAGSDIWHKSGVRDNTYDDVMTKARNGREIYCVITDMWGNSVTTDIVKLIAVPSVELKLLGQSYEAAALGEKYCVTVNAQGEGLKYQWYFRNAGSTKWYKSSVKDNTYDDVMTSARANREVYCVVTDAYGNQIVTDVVILTVEK